MLYSAVVRFEHPGSGRRVTVVATVHVGPAAYYERLRAVINELESAGAVVCYESPEPVTEQEWAAASDEERAAAAAYWEVRREHFTAASRHFGWVDQWAALGNSASWRNADLTGPEFVRRAGPQNLLSMQRGGQNFAGLAQDQQEAFASGAYAVSARLAQFTWFRSLVRLLAWVVGDAARRVDDVLFDDRNSHALAGLPAGADAVLPWGGGHLPGLAAGLRKAGYRRRHTTWVAVCRLPAIWTSIRALWVGMKALWTQEAPGDHAMPPTGPDSTAADDRTR
jgi:hypothetical protein